LNAALSLSDEIDEKVAANVLNNPILAAILGEMRKGKI
jgi:hypothetical protein